MSKSRREKPTLDTNIQIDTSNTQGLYSVADQPHVYALQYQSRCLESVTSTKDAEGSWFMTGTSDPGPHNELRAIRFDDSGDNISRSFKHPGMIMSLSPCPQDPRLVFTCHTTINNGTKHGATLWEIPEAFVEASASSSSPANLTEKTSFEEKTQKILWDPTAFSNRVIQLKAQSASCWSLDTDMFNASLSRELLESTSTDEGITCGTWHAPSYKILFGRGSDLIVCDLRSPSISSFDSTHQGGVLSIDGNPHLPHILASGGRDGSVKLWDYRQYKEPLYQITHHTHWVWDVAFNPQYDQLILTASSDSLVNLESVNSLSSLSGLGTNSSRSDRLVCPYSQHEDSVYSVAWSPSNPWLFASVSFDGQLMFCRVPDYEKYNIIL
ncbi:hypothetical protein DSO57_1005551 [Entomophthora muscae]|uniref:Uncharacterized protein n=1 Tax=Entomophthora muscae TaxID=34485 RepID=A0ACC2TIL8_9FUNG|nr:hypothetical protein DSO57_1005551 [Entomophthora muscae]